jgi:tRNA (guanine37-N1)-methyltransferase
LVIDGFNLAHFNLRKEYDDYKKIIGEVILAKTRNIKTVVNKVDNIDNTFRFFKMELLAGEDNLIAVQKEGNCTYKFDFSKVYWNSRLQGEHERLVNNFQKGDIICDVFGGIGPFALPAAKNRKCFVFVNDLNPDSYKYLNENITLNKTADKVSSYNMDGRDFIANSLNLVRESKVWVKFKEVQIQYSKLRRNSDRKVEDQPEFPLDYNFIPDHYIMNLPATAIDFLDAFIGLFKNSNVEKLPMIHCYCFGSKNEPEIEITQRVTHKIGAVELNIRHVRNVAPNKDMYCVSFRLPASIAYKNELKRKLDKEI